MTNLNGSKLTVGIASGLHIEAIFILSPTKKLFWSKILPLLVVFVWLVGPDQNSINSTNAIFQRNV